MGVYLINTGFIWGVFGEVGVAGGEAWLFEPRVARIVGKKASPWNTPYNTVKPNTLKKVMKTWEAEKGRMMTASRVVMPAFTMAGPRVTKAFCALSVLVPEKIHHSSFLFPVASEMRYENCSPSQTTKQSKYQMLTRGHAE